MALTPEAKVKAKIKKILIDAGVYYAMPVTGGFGNSGVPDFLCCVNGRFLAIEAKAGRGKTTALQDKHLNDIQLAGGVATIVDETKLNALEEIIEHLQSL